MTLVFFVIFLCRETKSILKLSLSTCYSFLRMLITLRLQNYINSFCITKIHKNTYEVQLVIQKKRVKFKIKISNGPSKFLQIIDNDTNNDMTSTFEPYFTYEILPTTLEDHKLNKIELYFTDGEVKYFEQGDALKLN